MENLPSSQELLMSIICFAQFVLLGTFAAILSAHRSDIIEKTEEAEESTLGGASLGTYEAPNLAAE
jgi:hypothetical protein